MADLQFFQKKGPFKLSELAQKAECQLIGEDKEVYDVKGLTEAESNEISWAFLGKLKEDISNSKAGAIITNSNLKDYVPKGTSVLLSADPHRSYGIIADLFYPYEVVEKIHSSAVIDETAQIGAGCQIDAGVVVGKNVKIGRQCHLRANAVIGDGVEMGDGCIIGENASVLFTKMGHKVYIYPGARIGQDGFGFAMSPERGPMKVPQLGRVLIGNDVEIGANTTVDRGAMGDTIIGDGCRIDNLVQVAHNVHLGRCCVLVSQVGVAGSCHFGDFVVAGGQSGFAGHLNIGSGAQIGAQSGVMRDVDPMSTLLGSPAINGKDFMRLQVLMKKFIKGE